MNGDSRFRPWEIRMLTMPEIALLLDQHGDKPAAPSNAVTFASHEEHLAYIQQRRSMTVKERFEEAIRDSRQ